MTDYSELVGRLGDQRHLMQGDGLNALLKTAEEVAHAIETLTRELGEARVELRTEIERYGIEMLAHEAARAELTATKARLAEAVEENERLRKLAKPEWFYAPDSYESDCCQDSPEEVIDYAALFPGKHVFEVNCATSLPSIWCTVHVRTDKEMEALDTDDRTVITQFATEAEAAAFITK